MNWTDISEKLLLDSLGLILLFILALRLLFRPRSPKVIYAHLNTMIDRVGFWPVTGMLLGIHLISVLTYSYKLLPEDGYISVLPIFVFLLLLGLNTVYVLYWSQPFSRQRTGVRTVDEAVARYKKPGERAVGVIGGWCPDLVVDGKVYKLLGYYLNRTQIGLLAFDLDGNVIQEEALMHKVVACMRLAGQCTNPEEINARAAIHSRIEKAIAGVEEILSRYAVAARVTEAESKPVLQLNQIVELLNVMKQDFTLYKEYLEEEARECNLLGGTQAQKIPYTSVEKLNELWRNNRQWQLEAIGNLPAWKKAVKALKGQLKELGGYKDLRELVERALPEYLDTYRKVAEWQAAGEVEDRFAKIQPDEIDIWRSRLEWVQQVDGKKD